MLKGISGETRVRVACPDCMRRMMDCVALGRVLQYMSGCGSEEDGGSLELGNSSDGGVVLRKDVAMAFGDLEF